VKVGDLVRHCRGEIGLVIGLDTARPYPYLIWFFGSSKADTDWFVKSVFRIISESR